MATVSTIENGKNQLVQPMSEVLFLEQSVVETPHVYQPSEEMSTAPFLKDPDSSVSQLQITRSALSILGEVTRDSVAFVGDLLDEMEAIVCADGFGIGLAVMRFEDKGITAIAFRVWPDRYLV